jgi:hypothetical protein
MQIPVRSKVQRSSCGRRIIKGSPIQTILLRPVLLTPVTAASLPVGWTIVGGGAQLENNIAGGGQLLTASYPEGNEWVAKSKAHEVASAKNLRAYVIGLNSGFLATSRVSTTVMHSDISGTTPERTCSTEHGSDVIGGGAHIENGQVSPGVLLTASYPVGQNQWLAKGKAHMYHDEKNLAVFCIGVKDL